MAARLTDEAILRAKYLDWCSAQVAERFLRLTPDEIYDLAHDDDSNGGPEPAPLDASPGPLLVYGALVRRATMVLAERLELPGFEEWSESYLSAPERYDGELVGFWKDVVGRD